MRDINSNVVSSPRSSDAEPLLLYPSLTAGQAVTRVVRRCQDAEEDQRLDLSECQLMQVPDAVYHLMRNTLLLWINLSSNALRRLPPKFAFRFNAITELNLSHNHLSSLPDELKDLNDLQRLDISHNHFLSLPRAVFLLPRLIYLNAQKNYITDVEAHRLCGIQSLKEVDVVDNPLNSSCRQQLAEVSHITVHVSEPTEDDMELDDID